MRGGQQVLSHSPFSRDGAARPKARQSQDISVSPVLLGRLREASNGSQPLIPSRCEQVHPACSFIESLWPHLEAPLASGALAVDESDRVKNRQMLHDRLPSDR